MQRRSRTHSRSQPSASKRNESGIRAILGPTLTEDLAKALKAVVQRARDSIEGDAQAVTPREHRAARRSLRALVKRVNDVRSMLAGDSYPSWLLQTVLAEGGVRDDALETIRENLNKIEEAARVAQARTGTHVLHAVQDSSGLFPITEEKWVLDGRAGRPRENARFVMALSAGLALERHGIRITKTRGGTYERLLRSLFREAGLYEPTDLHRLVIRTVDQVRWLRSHSDL